MKLLNGTLRQNEEAIKRGFTPLEINRIIEA